MDFVKKHMIMILCILSILLLLLPMVTVVSSMESAFISAGETSKAQIGFAAIKAGGIFGYLLIIGPALLVAMNYIEKLGKYKGVLAIVVPIVCVFALIIVLMQAKSGGASADIGVASMKVTVKLGIGAILLFITYIATAVAGAVIYHNFTLDKAGVEKLKGSAGEFFSAAQERVCGAIQNVTSAAGEIRTRSNSDQPEGTPASDAPGGESAPRPVKVPPKKSVSLNRTEEILSLIERLAKMRDDGILTDEEFSRKKQQLLEEI